MLLNGHDGELVTIPHTLWLAAKFSVDFASGEAGWENLGLAAYHGIVLINRNQFDRAVSGAPPSTVTESSGDEIDSGPSEPVAENGDDRSGSTTTPTSVTRTAKERRGRKPGSGSYESDDLPLIEDMKGLVGGVKGMSPWAAANSVAGKAKGAGTPESKAKRLYKLFRSN